MDVTIGTPKHGWVDLVISHGDFCLRDTISDVPCDFIGEMVVGLNNLLTDGSNQQFLLGLEPHYYELDISKKDERFLLSIKKVYEFPDEKNPELLNEMSGPADVIVLPLCFAICRFYEGRSDPGYWHWPDCDTEELERLKTRIGYENSR